MDRISPGSPGQTCDETLVHLGGGYGAPPLTGPVHNHTGLLPKTSRPHEYACYQRCPRRNRICWDQRREIPIVLNNTLVLYGMQACCCCCCCCSGSLSLSDIPPTHTHPRVHSDPPTCFHVYGVRLVNAAAFHTCLPTLRLWLQLRQHRVLVVREDESRSEVGSWRVAALWDPPPQRLSAVPSMQHYGWHTWFGESNCV